MLYVPCLLIFAFHTVCTVELLESNVLKASCSVFVISFDTNPGRNLLEQL